VKEAHQLLKQTTGIHYIGNIEGREIPVGEARGQRLDVVTCDGFVGTSCSSSTNLPVASSYR